VDVQRGDAEDHALGEIRAARLQQLSLTEATAVRELV
jgi:hypothetical protein